MKIIVDTNVLVRAFTRDEPEQSALADAALNAAEWVVVTNQTLCELVWVLRGAKVSRADILVLLRRLRVMDRVVTDGAAMDAGTAMLEAGGDFADGVIAHEGARLGGEIFVSFDRKAIRLLAAAGHKARLLD